MSEGLIPKIKFRNGGFQNPSVSFFIAALLGMLLFHSCDKKEYFEPALLPSDLTLTGNSNHGLGIQAWTERQDSVLTGMTSYNLAGSLRDSEFGISYAGFFSQFRLTGVGQDFGTNPVLDSIVLSLVYFDYYGDTTVPVSFSVRKLDEDLHLDGVYYSNRPYSTSDVIGSVFKAPRPSDSLNVQGNRSAPALRFRLYDTFGQWLIQSGAQNFADNANFNAFFKGLYITADKVEKDNSGSILAFDLKHAQSKLTVYYNGTGVYDFIVTDDCARTNAFSHQYENTLPEEQWLGTATDTDFVFVQGAAGLNARIFFPGLASLKDSGPVVINKAELVLSASSNAPAAFLPPAKLALSRVGENGSNLLLADQAAGVAYFGGSYLPTERHYKFNLAKYVQEVVDGKFTDYGLRLLVSGSAISPARLKLDAGPDAERPMVLKITYTRYSF